MPGGRCTPRSRIHKTENVSKDWCYCKVSNNSFLTELQEKEKETFTLMIFSQKCHAISVGLHA